MLDTFIVRPGKRAGENVTAYHGTHNHSCSLSQLGAVKEEKSVAAVRAEYNGQHRYVKLSASPFSYY